MPVRRSAPKTNRASYPRELGWNDLTILVAKATGITSPTVARRILDEMTDYPGPRVSDLSPGAFAHRARAVAGMGHPAKPVNRSGSRRRRNRAGSPKRSFDVFDADSSSGTLVPIGHPLALVRVGEALESRDFARALVTAKLVPARSKIIDGDGDGEVFGFTVRLPSGEVRQFFLQLAAEDLRGLARDYVEGQIESGASTKSSLIANPLSRWEPDDVRDATGLSEGASSAELQKAKAALASAIRAAARRHP